MKTITAFTFLLFTWAQIVSAQAASEYQTQITFPANYAMGNYIEFLKVSPLSAGASGYYEISISYTRRDVAAAATYIASITHSNPNLWREVGRINSNGYWAQTTTSNGHNFTVDCNTQSDNVRFRVRAINNLGLASQSQTIYIKVRAINGNSAWTTLNVTGNDLTVNKMLPMTNDWSLYVGDQNSTNSATLAIKAITNGNVGIGTANPQAKLAVEGSILAREVKVKNDISVPDYVFEEDYELPALAEIAAYVKEHKHLPEIPSAADIKKDGLDLAEMNLLLLKKVEELTLHMIALKSENEELGKQIKTLMEQH